MPKTTKKPAPSKSKTAPKKKTDVQEKKIGVTKPKFKKPLPAEKTENPAKKMVYQIKVLWEQVRRKDIPTEDRDILMEKLMEMIQGKVVEIIFKRDVTKVIQTCVKYGSTIHREIIADELKGRMVELAKGNSGQYLAKKLFKYAKTKRDSMLKEFNGNYAKLIKNKQAANVIEYIYTDIANAQQRVDILLEFYGPENALFKEKHEKMEQILRENPQKRSYVMKYLSLHVYAILNKGAPIIRLSLVHHLILQLLQIANGNVIQEVVSGLKESLPEIVHTREGARIAAIVIAHSNAKDRKLIVKSLKDSVAAIAREEYGHLAIMRILDVTDDTILTKKSILGELVRELESLVYDKYAKFVFLDIMANHSPKYFPQATLAYLQSTVEFMDDSGQMQSVAVGKKTSQVRLEDLLSYLSEPLLNYCAQHVNDMITDENAVDVFVEAVINCKGDKNKIYLQLANLCAGSGFLENPIIGRAIERLIKQEDTTFAVGLVNHLGDLKNLAMQKGPSLIVLILLEHSTLGPQVKAKLLPHIKQLATSNDTNCQIIVKKLKEK
eukprot:TRINITY_DN3060_c0_g1_i4.p1 TRINITY_DN3060_c0_g1~~TRINITY_DN3060_c0_g1_i4.p1  ORF type:complete len:571 (-),score=162.66 TRINITY_DN3060_c0_g1_i4:3-1658(-)